MSEIVLPLVFIILIICGCSCFCLLISVVAYIIFNPQQESASIRQQEILERQQQQQQDNITINYPEDYMDPRSKQIYDFYKDDWILANRTSDGIRINYEVAGNKLKMKISVLNSNQGDTFNIVTTQVLPKDKDLYELLDSKTSKIIGNMIVDKGDNNLRMFKILDKNKIEISGYFNGTQLPTRVYNRKIVQQESHQNVIKEEKEQIVVEEES